jgi:hypothetical protein
MENIRMPADQAAVRTMAADGAAALVRLASGAVPAVLPTAALALRACGAACIRPW